MTKLRFDVMCQGPNADKADEHEDRARFHAMMAKFYRLPQKEQRVFMAMLEAVVDEEER